MNVDFGAGKTEGEAKQGAPAVAGGGHHAKTRLQLSLELNTFIGLKSFIKNSKLSKQHLQQIRWASTSVPKPKAYTFSCAAFQHGDYKRSSSGCA